MATASIVATAYNMRYGKANTDAVDIGVSAGVAGLDVKGVGGLSESVADNAGEGIIRPGGPVGIAIRGEGAAIVAPDAAVGVSLTGEGGKFEVS